MNFSFSEIKNRDAWSAIRGFVYQVDITIQRWLMLEPNQILELERGEDIDIVNRGINGEEIERELEQVKFRESKATLNQEWVLEILLNFYLHKRNNPDKKVYFRFVTNSGYNMERPSIFQPILQKGIDVWNSIAEAEVLNETIKLTQDQLKTHLQKKIKSKTKKILDNEDSLFKNWSDFHDFIEDDENLFRFIKDFEWSFDNDDQTNISETIKQRIETIGLAQDRMTSEAVYSRLFLYVFKKLCVDSVKTLDTEELTTQTALPDLNQKDNDLLNSINQLLSSFNQRLDDLEDEVSSQRLAISSLKSKVLSIQSSDAVFDHRLSNLMITPPRLVKNGSGRQQKVIEILNLFTHNTWINIQGINGTGKSQLASSIYHYINNDQGHWLDLREYNESPEKTVLLLEAYLSSITQIPVFSDRDQWANQISQIIPKKSLIILNDLPQVDPDSALYALICSITDAFEKNEIKLLTTSNYEISTRAQQLLGPSVLCTYRDLDFTNEEIIEYFSNHGANEFITTHVDLIALLSYRNPSIISSILGYLNRINWGNGSTQLIEGILKQEFSREILENVQLLVSKNITDEKSRELLYRLSLIHWEFELDLVKCVSSVPEEIAHPNERLTDLLNIWIQGYDDSYQISPLIYDIGRKNLSDTLVERVHIGIAESIISTKKINQINASRCIRCFLEGKDYDRAGLTLLTAYNSTLDKQDAEHLRDWGYLQYWVLEDIPNQMNFTLRVQLRLEQARLSKLLDSDDHYFFNRLKEYSGEQGISINDQVLVHTAMLQNYDNLELSNFWHHFKSIVINYNQLDESYKEAIQPKVFARMLWFPVTNIKLEKDIKAWIELIELVKSQLAIDLLKNEPAQMAVTLVSSQVANDLNEMGEHDWPAKLLTLTMLKDRLELNGYETLSAVVLKDIINIEFEINDNSPKAIETTNTSIQKYKSTEAQYLLCENLGKLYFRHQKPENAIEWLAKAVGYNCESQLNFIQTLLYYASVLAPTKKQKALEQCLNAKRLAEINEKTGELFYLKVLGELGISYWLNDDIQNCLESFELLFTRLFTLKDKHFGEEWIRVLRFAGHASGYLAGEINGSAPSTVKGGEEYIKPYQGLIALSTADVSDIYEEKNDPIIMAQLAMLSGGLGNIQKASDWSQKAFDFARKNGDQGVLLTLASLVSKYLILNYKVAEAIETSIMFSAVTYHVDEFKNKEDAFDNINLVSLYNSKPSEKWNHAEHAVVTYTVIPLFIQALLYHIENTEQSTNKCQEFKSAVLDYYDSCSNKELWGVLIHLTTGILDNSITAEHIFNQVIYSQQRGWTSIQMIGILGLLVNTAPEEKHLEYLLNILPPIVNAQLDLSFNVISNIVAPFVKIIGLGILKTIYVGDKQTLSSIIVQIENVDTRQINCIQQILILLIAEAEIEIIADRKKWLTDE